MSVIIRVSFRFTGKLDRLTIKLKLPGNLGPTKRLINMTNQQISRTRKTCPTTSVRRAALAAIILALAMRGYTQEAQSPAGEASSPTQGTGAQPGPVMQQPALDELKRMSVALGAATSFTCKSRSTVEIPSRKTGQFITLMGNSEVAVQRPNKLRIRVTGEVPNFDFYYDGTNIVAYAPQNKVYSIARAPGTLDEMLKNLEAKTGIQFPAADMLFSNPYTGLSEGLTSAFVVGKSTADGVACEHLAFMSPGIHWQVWVDSGKTAVPQRLAVTYAGVQNFPRRLVEFSDWNLQPNLTDSDFVFQPPADVKQIDFLSSAPPTPTGREKGR